jgi:hypothetical protein
MRELPFQPTLEILLRRLLLPRAAVAIRLATVRVIQAVAMDNPVATKAVVC